MLGLGNTLSGGIVPAAAAGFTNTYSVDFDGTNDYIHVTNLVEWMGVGSYAFWAKITENNTTVLFSSHDDLGLILYIQFFTNRVTMYNKYLSVSAVQTTSLDTPLTDGVWHHWAMTFSGSPTDSNLKLYIDGVLLGDHSKTNGNAEAKAAGTLKIGHWSSQYWHGTLDEVGFWNNTVLDADAVVALYNSGVPIDLSSDSGDYDNSGDLTAYWRMGDGDTYPTIEDNKGSSDGTMTNMTSGDIVEDVAS